MTTERPNPSLELLIRMAERGASTAEIADATRYSRATVQEHRRRLGLPGKTGRPSVKRKRHNGEIAVHPAGMTYKRAFKIALAAHDHVQAMRQVDRHDKFIAALSANGYRDRDIAIRLGIPESVVAARRGVLGLTRKYAPRTPKEKP